MFQATLQIEVLSHHNAGESSSLVHHTHEAQQSLDSLPSVCSSGVSELILAEETKATQLMETCSKRTIFLQVAELLTDSAYFGFSLYNKGGALLSDIKMCSQEKCLLEKLICALDKSPGVVKSAVELVLGAVGWVLQVRDFLPKIENEIKECRNSTVTEYQMFLNGLVNKAILC